MTAEKFSIEVDSNFVESLFGLADMSPPANLSLDDLNSALSRIKSKISNQVLSSVSSQSKELSIDISGGLDQATSDSGLVRPKTILIVDDLGIITYQLEILFKKLDFDVVISHEIYDAIKKFKTQDFGYVIMDLFIPTEREGFILLDELKKLTLLCKLNTRLIVMTASSKQEYQTKCTNRGADFYVEKSAGWQKKVVEVCLAK